MQSTSELDNASIASSATSKKERDDFQKRIQTLERQLSGALNRPSSSAPSSRNNAKVAELESEVLTLRKENNRLREQFSSTTTFPLSPSSRSNNRSTRHPNLSHHHSDENDVFSTPTPSNNARAKTRPRSSSLNSDSKITNLEQEISRLKAIEIEADSVRSKLAKAQRDLFITENEKLAVIQGARKEKEVLQEALEEKEDELTVLRYNTQQNQVQDNGEMEALREQLEEKESRLRAIGMGIANMQAKLAKTVQEVDVGVQRRKSRPPVLIPRIEGHRGILPPHRRYQSHRVVVEVGQQVLGVGLGSLEREMTPDCGLLPPQPRHVQEPDPSPTPTLSPTAPDRRVHTEHPQAGSERLVTVPRGFGRLPEYVEGPRELALLARLDQRLVDDAAGLGLLVLLSVVGDVDRRASSPTSNFDES